MSLSGILLGLINIAIVIVILYFRPDGLLVRPAEAR